MKFIQLKDIAANEKNAIVDGPFGSSMKTSDYVSEGIPVLQGKNITGDKFNFFDIRFITEKKSLELSRSKVVIGDYLLVKIGSIGYLARVDTLGGYEYAIIPANLAKIKIDEKKIYPAYFEHIFKQKFVKRNLLNLSSKTAQPALSLGKIKAFEIPIPDRYTEQIYIANILSQTENLIAQRKESIRLLDEFLKSTFLEMFGESHKSDFPLCPLEKVSNKITDGEHGTIARVDFGRLYLMARNISNENKIIFSEVSYISEKDHLKIFRRCNPEKGDLLLVCVGATIGKVAIVPEMDDFSLARSVALIKPKRKLLNSNYLLWFFNSPFGRRQVKNNSNEAAQAGLYTGNIKQIIIPIPPIELQTKFAQIVESTEEVKAQYQSSLQELDGLYGSLSQRAFKGELEAKDGELLMAAEPTAAYIRKP